MKPGRRTPRGFALLLTVALLSLMVVLLLGLVALVQVEARAADNAAALFRARAQARLAVAIALGQLQRHAGGDVVTARADVAGAAVAHPAWTGVWAATVGGGPQTWLVSGNERVPLALGPEVASAGPDDVLLLRRNLPSGEHVRARKVDVTTVLPGGAAPRVIGRYAFWVGDESLKMSLNVRTDTPPLPGFARHPVPRTESVVAGLVAASTNDARAKLLTVDQLLLPPFNVHGNSLNALWPAATAAAPRLFVDAAGGPRLVPGAFNANSRSAAAWSAYLDAPGWPVAGATVFAAIRDAERPFRSLADLQAKLAANPAIGAGHAATIVDGLAPILGVRGDTFLVRAYGEAVHPHRAASDPDYVTAAAYGEAIVQRTTTLVPGFGYRYELVYFRWLAAEDI
jgi:hypothetical protein